MTEDNEYPATEFPNIERWTENYWFVAFDHERELAIWMHFSRAQWDPELWREVCVVFEPGDDRLLSKAYGRAGAAKGPGAACLSATCLEPWVHWALRFDGAATRSTGTAMFGRAVPDGAHAPLEVAVDWKALAPVWGMGSDMSEQTWGDLHYQQVGRATGTIVVDGEAHSFDGTGIRDHTRGPRDYSDVGRHAGIHGWFPSGHGFQVLDIESGGHRMSEAVLLEDGEVRPVAFDGGPLIDSHADGPAPYTLRLGEHTIEAEVVQSAPLALAATNDLVLGFDPEASHHTIWECMTTFDWNGERGWGLTERSTRG